MATRKKTSKSPRSKAPAAKKAPAKKPSAKKPPAKKASASKAAPAGAGKGGVGAESVNLGHILALRGPRVNPAFPQAELLKARRELSEERYASIEEAARAVAEKALASTNKKPSKRSIGRR